MVYFQLLPEKVFQNFIDIESCIKSEIKGYSSDNMKEIISIISCHIHKPDESDKSLCVAPLKMEYLKKIVPQGDRYLIGLINLGIVQRSGTAIKGQTSYKYSFTDEYLSKYVSIPLKNAKLIRRIETARNDIIKEAAKSLRNHNEQTKYLKLLTIDDSFKEYIESNYTINTDQFNSVLGSATRIINGDIFYSIDATSLRFHSNVTNMAKGLRQFLRIKDEPLINIDIKNSQPYLSTIFLTQPSKVSWMTSNPAFALLLQTLKVSLNQDVKDYISLVISGQIYEYLMCEFLKEGLVLSRNETKTQMLRILFSRNRMPANEINKKCRQVFIKSFPTVHKIFTKIRGHEKGDKFKNFKRFAILLQRIESYLMLDVILKRIYKELPGTIAITIHDSIMTGILTNNVEAIKNIITEEMTFFIGFEPKIKIENESKDKRKKESKEISYTNTMLQPL